MNMPSGTWTTPGRSCHPSVIDGAWILWGLGYDRQTHAPFTTNKIISIAAGYNFNLAPVSDDPEGSLANAFKGSHNHGRHGIHGKAKPARAWLGHSFLNSDHQACLPERPALITQANLSLSVYS
jgi:hypothetical protein